MNEREKLLDSITLLLQSPEQVNVDIGFLQLLNLVGNSVQKGLEYYTKIMVVFCSNQIPLRRHGDYWECCYEFYYNIPFLQTERSPYFDVKAKGRDNIDFEGRKATIKKQSKHYILWKGERIVKLLESE